MEEENRYYALAMDEYSGKTSSLSCYNLSDYMPMKKCFALISVCNGYVGLDDVGFKDIVELQKTYPNFRLSNEQQFLKCSSKASGERLFFVLGFDSNDRFENGGLNAEADNEEAMFCVLELYDNWAEVLDWGYSNPKQLLSAWNTETFQNVGKSRQYSLETK